MILGLSTASLFLMTVGGLAMSIAHAVRRRDFVWVLALGLPLLFCADQADLPSTLIAWGCALYALAGGLFLLGHVVRGLGAAAGIGIVAAASVLGLSTGVAEAHYVDLAAASLHHPPLIGIWLEGWLRTLAYI